MGDVARDVPILTWISPNFSLFGSMLGPPGAASWFSAPVVGTDQATRNRNGRANCAACRYRETASTPGCSTRTCSAFSRRLPGSTTHAGTTADRTHRCTGRQWDITAVRAGASGTITAPSCHLSLCSTATGRPISLPRCRNSTSPARRSVGYADGINHDAGGMALLHGTFGRHSASTRPVQGPTSAAIRNHSCSSKSLSTAAAPVRTTISPWLGTT